MFFIIIMFMLMTLPLGNKTYMYKGMCNTNHILTKIGLIHPLERIWKNIQDSPMNCTEQSPVANSEEGPS